MEHFSPISYAAQLASYISDPSTIRARVLDEYGRAPTIEQCRNLRAQKVREKEVINRRRIGGKRFAATFRCGHPQTDANTVIGMNGNDRCASCEKRKIAAEKKRQEEREAVERARAAQEAAEREAKRVKIEQALNRLVKKVPAERPRIGTALLGKVADFFGLTPADLIGKRKFDILVDARTVFALIMRERGLSYPQIGRFMERDHSTVINLTRKAAKRIERNPLILVALERLR